MNRRDFLKLSVGSALSTLVSDDIFAFNDYSETNELEK